MTCHGSRCLAKLVAADRGHGIAVVYCLGAVVVHLKHIFNFCFVHATFIPLLPHFGDIFILIY